jgi:hypothetical protein
MNLPISIWTGEGNNEGVPDVSLDVWFVGHVIVGTQSWKALTPNTRARKCEGYVRACK